MILLLDTSTPTCNVTLIKGDARTDYSWEAHRELAKGLLGYLTNILSENGASFDDIEGIVAFRGPGSFTGLRIGLTVLNTIADAAHVPIVGTAGDRWQDNGLARLENGEDDHVVLPEYGGEAHITAPRK